MLVQFQLKITFRLQVLLTAGLIYATYIFSMFLMHSIGFNDTSAAAYFIKLSNLQMSNSMGEFVL